MLFANYMDLSRTYLSQMKFIDGIVYEKNSVVITGAKKTVLQFGIVKAIFIVHCCVYFFISELETVHYSAHYHSNIVQQNLLSRAYIIEPKIF